MNTISIYIYAELLLNIRQISASALLPSESNETTSLTLSSDRNFLSLEHNGETARLRLPAPVRDGFGPRASPGSTRNISLRLPIAEETAVRIGSTLIYSASSSVWTASWMRQNTQIACQSCQSLLVKESVKTWKDLPSENWAEMMDFWHCHKPDTEDSLGKATGPQKGYGAANGIGPTAGVALVDAMYLHLLHPDCNVTLRDIPTGPKVSLFSLFFLLR